jgi:hypothetical protein
LIVKRGWWGVSGLLGALALALFVSHLKALPALACSALPLVPWALPARFKSPSQLFALTLIAAILGASAGFYVASLIWHARRGERSTMPMSALLVGAPAGSALFLVALLSYRSSKIRDLTRERWLLTVWSGAMGCVLLLDSRLERFLNLGRDRARAPRVSQGCRDRFIVR